MNKPYHHNFWLSYAILVVLLNNYVCHSIKDFSLKEISANFDIAEKNENLNLCNNKVIFDGLYGMNFNSSSSTNCSAPIKKMML